MIRRALALAAGFAAALAPSVRAADASELWPELSAVQIQQVLVNLLLNAFDALAAVPSVRRRVVVSARPVQGRVAMAVARMLDPDCRRICARVLSSRS